MFWKLFSTISLTAAHSPSSLQLEGMAERPPLSTSNLLHCGPANQGSDRTTTFQLDAVRNGLGELFCRGIVLFVKEHSECRWLLFLRISRAHPIARNPFRSKAARRNFETVTITNPLAGHCQFGSTGCSSARQSSPHAP